VPFAVKCRMGFAAAVFAFVMRSGGWGLLILGILDSSYLFAPWGNDVLLAALTVRHPQVTRMLYYALMSTIGSVLGCLLIDVTLRRAGEKGLKKYLSPRAMKRMNSKVRDNVGRSLAVASLIPPPFPFTPFVMAAAALQYPRQRLLGIIAVTRLVRFVVLGFLALRFGERLTIWAKMPAVQYSLVALMLVCMVGSVISVYGWIRKSRAAGDTKPVAA
jgi:membrane protein YqaA with SNARE-associated domain